MKLQFDILQFLTRNLQHHKRQENRINLFYWPIKQINALWSGFVAFRQDKTFEANITGQKMSLVALLNKEVTGSNDQIYIDEIRDYGVYLSLISEDQDFAWLSTAAEDSDFIWLAKEGEISEALGADFIIYIPSTAVKSEVKEIADRYVLAQMEYEIEII